MLLVKLKNGLLVVWDLRSDFMYYIYLLTHRRCVEFNERDGAIYDTKVLGIYSNYKSAKEAIAFFGEKVGFRDFKNDFCIQKRKLFGNDTKEPKTSVFLIEFERLLYDNLYTKQFIGICADEQTVQEIIAISQQKMKYNDATDDYDIIEYVLDEHSTYWSEGFD